MIILSVKTDQTLAELGLCNDLKVVDKLSWEAHRTLADTIHLQLAELLKRNSLTWQKIEGIVCFKGPGSFTGLRIGLSVANALAYSSNCPIVSATGDNWQPDGLKKLIAGQNEKIVLPFYGSEANITKPKK
jgi:tRNA threonylcarbamoyladenosine biosynthesis protein TsaB